MSKMVDARVAEFGPLRFEEELVIARDMQGSTAVVAFATEIPERPAGLWVNQTRVALDELTLTGLADTMGRIRKLEGAGYAADCTVFGGMLCGAAYDPVSDRQFWDQPSKKKHYTPLGEPFATDDREQIEELPFMVPILFDNPDSPEPNTDHIGVRLPMEPTIIISKIGENGIALARPASLAKLYRSTTIVPLAEMTLAVHGREYMHYEID